MKNLVFILIASFFIYGCMPLTTNSTAFRNMQSDLVSATEQLKEVSRQTKFIADQVGVKVKDLSPEIEARIQLMEKHQAEQLNAFTETLKGIMPFIKVGAPIAGQALGIPAPVTSAGISTLEAVLIGGASLIGGHSASQTLASRRRKKEDEEWEEYCKDLEEKREKERKELQAMVLNKA